MQRHPPPFQLRTLWRATTAVAIPRDLPKERQRQQLDLLEKLNQNSLKEHPNEPGFFRVVTSGVPLARR